MPPRQNKTRATKATRWATKTLKTRTTDHQNPSLQAKGHQNPQEATEAKQDKINQYKMRQHALYSLAFAQDFNRSSIGFVLVFILVWHKLTAATSIALATIFLKTKAGNIQTLTTIGYSRDAVESPSDCLRAPLSLSALLLYSCPRKSGIRLLNLVTHHIHLHRLRFKSIRGFNTYSGAHISFLGLRGQ